MLFLLFLLSFLDYLLIITFLATLFNPLLVFSIDFLEFFFDVDFTFFLREVEIFLVEFITSFSFLRDLWTKVGFGMVDCDEEVFDLLFQ